MKSIYPPRIQRLAWLEGIRFWAALLILLYHYQLLFSDYAFAPQGTGLVENWDRILRGSGLFGQHWAGYGLSWVGWFGYQWVDWFVLVSGFSLVLSLKGKPLVVKTFLRDRLWRILLPFWTTALLAYPVLWAIGFLTKTYMPDAWHSFAGLTFPLLFDFSGRLLLSTSGPWWFVPLIVSFALLFPLLWKLAGRWGMKRLLGVAIAITLAYRCLAVYILGGHPTYAIQAAAAGWQPFVPFMAKLGTFVVGMAVAVAYTQGRGVLYWSGRKAIALGLPIYTFGFVCQFYGWGWIFADTLIALGLGLVTMAVFRPLSRVGFLSRTMTYLGKHSYSYFLVHNFVIDRLIRLWVKQDIHLYYWGLLISVVGTFGLALAIDKVTPLLERGLITIWRWMDRCLTRPAVRTWMPMEEDLVLYQGQWGWQIAQVEKVEHSDRTFYLCRISRMGRTLWVNQQDLVLDEDRDRTLVGR